VGKLLLFKSGNLKNSALLVLFLALSSGQRLTATTFYLNDTSTKGDRYTTTVGNDANDGKSSSTPKINIRAVYDMAQDGDTIIVDTGIYPDLASNGALTFTINKKIKFIISGVSDVVFSKTPLPPDTKVSPTNIYIENDKPTDRETYLRRLQNGVIKKSP